MTRRLAPVDRIAELAGVAGEQPAPAPDLLDNSAVDRLVTMERALQRPARPVRRKMVREFPLQALLHPVTMPPDNKNNLLGNLGDYPC